MKHFPPLSSSALFLTLMLVLPTASLNAAVVFSDTFTNSSPDRDAGDSLNGLTTETGGGTWVGRNAFTFTASGSIIVPLPTPPSGGTETRVMSVASPLLGGQVYTLEADLTAPVNELPADWGAIGFANNPGGTFDSGFYNSPVGQLWMYLAKDGSYGVVAGAGTFLTTGLAGAAPLFNATGFNHLSLNYDTSTNIASASINGTSILGGYDLDGLSFTPTISHSGFMFHRVDGAQIDNFSLSATAVPEPARMLLLALGSLGVILRRRRRSWS